MDTPDSGALRLFVAFELPELLRRRLAEAIERLRRYDQRAVKWVDPENMHLTLKFLGETAPEKLGAIKASLGAQLGGNSVVSGAFKMTSQTLGAFPNLKRPRVFWADCAGGDFGRLAEFAERIDETLSGLGFEKETRAFKAHLTLGRVRRPKPASHPADLTELINQLKAYKYEPIDFEFNRLVLFQSELTREGPIYTELESWV
ncbi:MAG: RNA 2',3'-cyclic phosphodiesterase [Candidatus Zixiibacteriota bacterium]